MTKAQKTERLNKLVGSLSAPSKMPCSGYNTPATECKIGSYLVNVPRSTCSNCYALKGRYTFKNVIKAMYHRFNSIHKPYWVESMVEQITLNNKGDKRYFRWHDSGDIASIDHFVKIKEIAYRMPQVKFWLPTREFKMLKDWANKHTNKIPDNLTVRFSSHMKDAISAEALSKKYASIVVSSEDKANELAEKYGREILVCPATKKESNHKCNDCRACWDSEAIIAYLEH